MITGLSREGPVFFLYFHFFLHTAADYHIKTLYEKFVCINGVRLLVFSLM